MEALIQKLKVKKNLPLWLVGIDERTRKLFNGLEIRDQLPAKEVLEQLIWFVNNKKRVRRSYHTG